MAIKLDITGGPGLQQLSNDVNNLNAGINAVNGSAESLKTQLRKMTQELQGLEPGSARFQELSIQAGKLRDTIQDTNAVINATAGSGVENLSKGLGGIASTGIAAFQGITAAQALFGAESEEVQKTLVKLQALAGLSDAIKSLGSLGDTMTTVKASFTAAAASLGLLNTASATTATVNTAAATATGAQAVATEGATVASNALNVSLLANPIVLITAGIVAAVAALYLFGDATESAEDKQKRLDEQLASTNERIKNQKTNLDDLLLIYDEQDRRIIASAKLRGDSEEEIERLEQRAQQNRARTLRDEAELSKAEFLRLSKSKTATQEQVAAQEKAWLDISRAATEAELSMLETQAESAVKARNVKKKDVDDRIEIIQKFQIDEEAMYRDQIAQLEKIDQANAKKEEATAKESADKQAETQEYLSAFRIKLWEFEIQKQEENAATEEEINKQKIESYSNAFSEVSKAFASLGTPLGNVFAQLSDNLSNLLTTVNDDAAATVDKVAAAVQAVGGLINGFIQMTMQANNEALQEDLKNIQTKNDAEQKSLEDRYNHGLITREHFEKASADIDQRTAEERDKIAKDAFDKNKKLQIASTIINGLQAAIGVFSSLSSIPYVGYALGAVAAAAVAGLTAANVSSIKNTQFEGGSTSSSGSAASMPSLSSASSAAAQPSFNLFGNGNNANTIGAEDTTNSPESTGFSNSPQVSVTEINRVQQKVRVIEDRNTL